MRRWFAQEYAASVPTIFLVHTSHIQLPPEIKLHTPHIKLAFKLVLLASSFIVIFA